MDKQACPKAQGKQIPAVWAACFGLQEKASSSRKTNVCTRNKFI